MTDINTTTPIDLPIFHPAAHCDCPDDVLNDLALSVAEKRIILSSWASDMYHHDQGRSAPVCPVVLGFVLLESRTEYPLTPYRQQCSHNHGSQKQANEAKSSKASKNSNRCLGTRKSLHVLYPAGGCDIARDPANGRRRDRNHVTLVRDAAAAFNLLQFAARFLPVRLVPISAIPLSGVGRVTLSSHARRCRNLAGKRTAGATPHNGRPRIVVRSGRHNLAVEHQGRAIRVLHGIQRASIVTESGHVEHHRVLLAGDVRTEDP